MSFKLHSYLLWVNIDSVALKQKQQQIANVTNIEESLGKRKKTIILVDSYLMTFFFSRWSLSDGRQKRDLKAAATEGITEKKGKWFQSIILRRHFLSFFTELTTFLLRREGRKCQTIYFTTVNSTLRWSLHLVFVHLLIFSTILKKNDAFNLVLLSICQLKIDRSGLYQLQLQKSVTDTK